MKLEDFACQADGCAQDAAEIIETDAQWGDEAIILLCRRHHDAAGDRTARPVFVAGNLLICDEAGSWFFVGEATR